MPDVTRRTLAAAAGLIGTGLATAAAQQPPELRAVVAGGKVEVPPLLAPTEAEGEPANRDPAARRLGIHRQLLHTKLARLDPSGNRTSPVGSADAAVAPNEK